MTRRNPLGSVYERSEGVYELRKSVKGPDGSTKVVRETVHGTYADAIRRLSEISDELGAKTGGSDQMTLSQYFWGRFLVDLRAKGRYESTLKGYESTFKRHLEPEIGEMALRDVENRAYDQKLWSKCSPNTSRKAFRLLRQVMRSAWDVGLLQREPMRRRMPLDTHHRGQSVVWTAEEALEGLRRLSASDSELLVPFCLMVGGGLRREEALAVTESDYVTVGDTLCVSVTKAVTDEDGLKPTKTQQSVRVVGISEPFASELRKRRGTWSLRWKPNVYGRKWTRMFSDGGILCGMRRCEMRTLRHANETMMLESGVDPVTVAKLHGHSQAVSYANYLVVTSPAALRAAKMVSDYAGRSEKVGTASGSDDSVRRPYL